MALANGGMGARSIDTHTLLQSLIHVPSLCSLMRIPGAGSMRCWICPLQRAIDPTSGLVENATDTDEEELLVLIHSRQPTQQQHEPHGCHSQRLEYICLLKNRIVSNRQSQTNNIQTQRTWMVARDSSVGSKYSACQRWRIEASDLVIRKVCSAFVSFNGIDA